MTENDLIDPAKAGALAQQIVTLLSKEDSPTRQRAMRAAMTLLGEGLPQQPEKPREANHPNDIGPPDLAEFFNREGDMKPADNAQLCAAYHYSLYGTAPFSVAEIRTIAADAGVVIPDRLDMTFGQAAKKGKKLFQSAGRGSYKPTASGGLEFGQRWAVRPGRGTKTPATE